MDRKKHADLETAKTLRGTCEDMCPEKERWVREDRRRLSAYEIIPGTDLVSYSEREREREGGREGERGRGRG